MAATAIGQRRVRWVSLACIVAAIRGSAESRLRLATELEVAEPANQEREPLTCGMRNGQPTKFRCQMIAIGADAHRWLAHGDGHGLDLSPLWVTSALRNVYIYTYRSRKPSRRQGGLLVRQDGS